MDSLNIQDNFKEYNLKLETIDLIKNENNYKGTVSILYKEEKAEIRSEKNYEDLSPDKKLAIELLDKIHGRIIKEMVLKV